MKQLTREQIRQAINLAFTQYYTLDYDKCEHPGTIVMGVVTYRLNGELSAVPFGFTNEKERLEVLDEIASYRMDSIQVSFAQHFIHYNTADKPL